MASYLGDYTTANTVYVYWNTFDSNDPSASVTLTGLALGDILIYKNGSVTERSSTAGFTLLDTDGIDFDGKTGIHGFSIDLSNNTDSGFYAAGGEYTVVVASVTVDAATVNFVAAHFSIERTGGALALLKGTNSLSDIESKIDTLTTNVATVDTVVDGIVTTLGTPAGASVSADIAAIEAQTDDIGAAGAGLTSIPWNASWDAEVQSEVADALAAFWTTPGTLVDLIWDEATSGHTTAGTTGKALIDATAPTAAAVADAVWDEALSGHLSAGSTGEALNAAGAAGDPWTTTLPGSYTGSQAGKMLSDVLTDTADMQPKLGTPAGASISADIAAIEAQTDDIGAAGAGLSAIPWNSAWDAEVQSEVADALTAAAIPTATQNADALLNRDMSAVSDTTARSPLNALRLLRNKWTSSGGTLTVTKEDDTTSAWTATLTGDAAADPVVGSDPA